MALESAKSSLISSLISESKTAKSQADHQMQNCFHDRPLNYIKDLMAAVIKVTKEDIMRVLKEQVRPIFSPLTGGARIVVTTNPTQADQIVEGFIEMGLKVEKIDADQIYKEES